MPQIKIACTGAEFLELNQLTEFQGELKTLSHENYIKLRGEILETGFAFPFHVWENDGLYFIIGGHQRKRTLLALRDEGFTIPPLPVVWVYANTYADAKRRVLQDVSQYGTVERQGLYQFLVENKMPVEQLQARFDVPEFKLDIPKFKNEFFDEPEAQKDEEKRTGNLVKNFVVPPFSVLDTRQGYWRERKQMWLERMGEKGESRQGTLSKGGDNIVAGINNGVSILDPVLAEAMLKWFTRPGSHILDPFAGDTVFGYLAKALGHHFVGIELRNEQVLLNQKRCDTLEGPGVGSAIYFEDTSENLDEYIKRDEQMDFLFSCPPYFDLEVYSDKPEDLSNQETYEEFFTLISRILHKAVDKLKPNSFACIVITELRNKNGEYYNFVGDMVRIMTEAGLEYYNELILLNAIGTAQMRANRYMVNRKMVRVHQNVLVFYKGDVKEIATHFPKLTEDYDAALAGSTQDDTNEGNQ